MDWVPAPAGTNVDEALAHLARVEAAWQGGTQDLRTCLSLLAITQHVYACTEEIADLALDLGSRMGLKGEG